MADAKILRFNVGGQLFATSSSTLKAGGESFFSGLLSGRMESARDEKGAYFIDRSPKYFDCILQFLRTGELEYSDDINRVQLIKEAEFYGLETMKRALEKQIAEEAKEELVTGPMLEVDGCYIDDENSCAYLFAGDGTLIVVTGNQAFTQALVIHTHKKVPTEWKREEVLQRSYALFYEAHIQRGKYTMNADGLGMVIMLPGGNGSIAEHLATLAQQSKALCVTSFCCVQGTGKGLFKCSHDNPHHFHLYKFKHF